MNPALLVACPHCGAAARSNCTMVGSGSVLRLSAAHPSRLEAAGLAYDASAVDRYRAALADASTGPSAGIIDND